MIRLSQSHLALLELCTRKFQYTYLDQVVAPTSPEELARREWGSQFHLRMQQRELGLSSVWDAGLLQRATEALVAALPGLFDENQTAFFRQSEHRRSLDLPPYLLTVIYDLVLLGEDQAQILDWKTYPKPLKRKWLAQSWQTRLYLFVLAETTSYKPEQISMTYWFVSPHVDGTIAPESLTFAYDTAQHETTRRTIQDLLAKLTRYLQDYHQGTDLPQISEAAGLCPTCPYALRCGRSPQSPNTPLLDIASLVNIDQIEEIPL